MEIKKVGVIGLGVMGAGVAQVNLQAGYDVYVSDVSMKQVEAGLSKISNSLNRQVEKVQLTKDEVSNMLERLTSGTELDGYATCDLVIEAVIDKLPEKRKVFEELDRVCPARSILASNTSMISITSLSAATNRPERVIGLHFFNPAPIMKLVEVTRTIVTDADVLDTSMAYVKSINKTPILTKDKAGFIVNKVMSIYQLEAMRAVDEGLASVEDIDNAITLGCGYPMGPLKLCDFIGLDVLLDGAEVLFNEYREVKYAPPTILRRLVSLGHVGMKSGRGFYDWSDRKKPVGVKF
jgi:3-hydroxybutyryl-CoA dehydrogenase